MSKAHTKQQGKAVAASELELLSRSSWEPDIIPGKGVGLGFSLSGRPSALDWRGVPARAANLFACKKTENRHMANLQHNQVLKNTFRATNSVRNCKALKT